MIFRAEALNDALTMRSAGTVLAGKSTIFMVSDPLTKRW